MPKKKSNASASKRGRQSRRSGHAWERRCCRRLTETLDVKAQRNLEEVRSGNCGDIVTSAPFAIQCKSGKRPPIFKAVAEAETVTPPGHFAVAMIHRNRRPGDGTATEIVAMPLDHWIDLAALALAYIDEHPHASV